MFYEPNNNMFLFSWPFFMTIITRITHITILGSPFYFQVFQKLDMELSSTALLVHDFNSKICKDGENLLFKILGFRITRVTFNMNKVRRFDWESVQTNYDFFDHLPADVSLHILHPLQIYSVVWLTIFLKEGTFWIQTKYSVQHYLCCIKYRNKQTGYDYIT